MAPDFDAMTNEEFEAHPDDDAKRDYIVAVYRAENDRVRSAALSK